MATVHDAAGGYEGNVGREGFRGRVVVVTGASSGVGRAVVRRFARDGALVALVARGADGLEAAADEVRELGGRALIVPADVADADAVERAADEIEGTLGPIDVWVNDAMTTVFSPFTEIEPDEFRRVIDVTFLGSVHGTRAALARMRPRDRGVIVQVGSALAYRAIPLQSAYCSAKHAIKGFTQSVRTELLHERSGVAITMVELPAMNTPQFDVCVSKLPRRAQPVPPIYQPEVAARAVHWSAAHPNRREVWVGATTAATIVANRLAPGLLDRYLARTGFDSQQTDEPENPDRPANLWEPVPGDHGAHGRFSGHARSLQLWAATHRGIVAAAGAGVLALAGRRLARGSR